MSDIYTKQTAKMVDLLKKVGFDAYQEFQNNISIPVYELDKIDGCLDDKCGICIAFGHVNETYGASVMTNCGRDMGYIETNLKFDEASTAQMLSRMITGIVLWKERFDIFVNPDGTINSENTHDSTPIEVEVTE